MKKIGILLTLITLLGLAAGCGDKPTAAPAGPVNASNVVDNGTGTQQAEQGEKQGAGDGSSDEQAGGGGETPASSSTKETIQVYFTDDNLMELQQLSREIEISTEHTKYEGAFKALQSADNGLIALWEKVVLNRISFDDSNGLLSIDISLPDEARLGAGGESLAIEALRKTMFQFDEVKQIELTVDGEQVESLMGHDDLDHPMTRS